MGFEEIETDPELNLKRVIDGEAQNMIFLCPQIGWTEFEGLIQESKRKKSVWKREKKGEVVVEKEDRENKKG